MNNSWAIILAWGFVFCLVGGQPGAGKGGKCPFSGGIMRKMTPSDFVLGVAESNVDIFGKDSLVLSPINGRVLDVQKLMATYRASDNPGWTGRGDAYSVRIIRDTTIYSCWDMDSCLVKEGQVVKAGEIIGYSRNRRISFFVTNFLGKIYKEPNTFLDCADEVGKKEGGK